MLQRARRHHQLLRRQRRPAFLNGEVAGITSGGTDNLCTQGWDLYTAVAAEIAFVDQYVPVAIGGGGGSGSGMGGGGGGDGGHGSGSGGVDGGRGSGSSGGHGGAEVHAGGCSTGSGDVGFAFAAAAMIGLVRRRRDWPGVVRTYLAGPAQDGW